MPEEVLRIFRKTSLSQFLKQSDIQPAEKSNKKKRRGFHSYDNRHDLRTGTKFFRT